MNVAHVTGRHQQPPLLLVGTANTSTRNAMKFWVQTTKSYWMLSDGRLRVLTVVAGAHQKPCFFETSFPPHQGRGSNKRYSVATITAQKEGTLVYTIGNQQWRDRNE